MTLKNKHVRIPITLNEEAKSEFFWSIPRTGEKKKILTHFNALP